MTRRQVNWAIAGLLSVFFTVGLSMNIVLTALPVIVGELDGNQIQYSWVVIINLLANASSTPIWGKLADTVSKKKLFQAAGVIFILACLIAGFAPTMEILLLGRLFQGVAMGGVLTLTMAIIASLISPRRRGRYAGWLGLCMTTSTMGGPLIGGLIVDTIGWRWCFLTGVPMTLVSLVVFSVMLKLQAVRRQVKLDVMGAALLVTVVSAVTIWLSLAGLEEFFPWTSWQSAVLLGSVAVLLIVFVVVERHSREPVIHLRMLTNRVTFLAVISSVSIAVALGALPPYLMQYLQLGRGLSPTEAGLMLVPLIGGNLVSTTISGRLIARTGRWKGWLIGGAVILTVSFFGLSLVAGAAATWEVAVILFLIGLGFGAQMQNLMLAVQNTVQVAQVGQASSIISFSRTFGAASWNSVLGSVMALQVGGLAVAAPTVGSGDPVYAEAAGTVFLVGACATIPAVLANALMPEEPLRTTI
ncbi:MFS transporter [Nesterenkonia ebinurensis]|uniref:MFS transporter n=1 Tax=Nesterenkonia ebinurensis TaxID=2608252 RepID=UPI00123CEF22|nr:MFS transporter [Nesterenkonia ebinurensis]